MFWKTRRPPFKRPPFKGKYSTSGGHYSRGNTVLQGAIIQGKIQYFRGPLFKGKYSPSRRLLFKGNLNEVFKESYYSKVDFKVATKQNPNYSKTM